MGQKNLIIKDLFKKLDTAKREHSKVDNQCHEDHMKVYKEKREILELIRQNACVVVVDPSGRSPMQGWVDDYNKKLSGLRASIKKNEGIRKIIGKVPIKDIAFVNLFNEYVRDIDDEGKKTDFYYEPSRLVHPYLNSWILNMQYFHGGPGSPVKVLFRERGNGHRYICGILLNESSKTRKGHTKAGKEAS